MQNCPFIIVKKTRLKNKQNYLTLLYGEKDLFE